MRAVCSLHSTLYPIKFAHVQTSRENKEGTYSHFTFTIGKRGNNECSRYHLRNRKL